LERMIRELAERDIQFMLAAAIGPTRDILKSSGTVTLLGEENFFVQTMDAVAFAREQKQLSSIQRKVSSQAKTKSSYLCASRGTLGELKQEHMKIEQIYTGCLAQGAYYIESDGQAAIIDPLREVEPYIKKAREAGAVITYIFETHFHADFVSGHLTLSKETGAPIIYGPTAKPSFEAIIAEDGQEVNLVKGLVKAL